MGIHAFYNVDVICHLSINITPTRSCRLNRWVIITGSVTSLHGNTWFTHAIIGARPGAWLGINNPSAGGRHILRTKRLILHGRAWVGVFFLLYSTLIMYTKHHIRFVGMCRIMSGLEWRAIYTLTQLLFYCLLSHVSRETWWRHQMETFSALLAICVGNSPVTHEHKCQ